MNEHSWLLLLTSTMMCAACGESGNELSPGGPPEVQITSPEDGAVVDGGAVEVRMDISYLWLARTEQSAPAWSPFEWVIPTAHAYEYSLGYAVLLLDGEQVAEAHTQGGVVLNDVPPGEHVLEAVLYYKSGRPVDPAANDFVDFVAE